MTYTALRELAAGLNWFSILLRVFLSLAVGGVLGLERGRKNRPAGFRTYILVCLGSALVMMTNQYVYEAFATSDPVRMGAQVISGIGFLGAGTIIVTGKNQVKGITTAAGLWTAACCGLAIGIGFYAGALVGGFTVVVVMSVMQKLDESIRHHSHSLDVYMELDNKIPMSQLIDYARGQDIEISSIQLNKNKLAKETIFSVVATLHSPSRNRDAITQALDQAPGLKYVEEIA